jgi:hypothetical protein
MVQCDQCSTISEGSFHSHTKRPESLCQKCTTTNLNKSDTKRASQSLKVDEEVKLKNNESNGLFILNFTEARKRCIVRCTCCNKEYERLYKPDIYEQCGCKTCARAVAARNTRKHHTIRYDDRLYQIFNSMLKRTGEYGTQDPYYTEHNIKVCDEWKKDRSKFFDWSLVNGYLDTLTIDRIDGTKDYSPDNCRWTTKLVQSRNTKLLRSTNTSGYRGVSLGISKDGYRARLTVNWKEVQVYESLNPKECAYYYDKYVRDHNLEHTKNFTDEEFLALDKAINLLNN